LLILPNNHQLKQMPNNNTYVAIMAGGVGSRFWPASRTARPKQFLDILGIDKSLLRMTFERFLTHCALPKTFSSSPMGSTVNW